VEGVEPGIWRYRPLEHDLALVGTDGTDEFVVYCAPVGRIKD
jgi:hypothetical protein